MKRRYQFAITTDKGLYTDTANGTDLVRKSLASENMYEWFYAIQDRIDDVLDLKVGESMYFQHDRGDAKSRGIILRID
jgi:hypothetical protein